MTEWKIWEQSISCRILLCIHYQCNIWMFMSVHHSMHTTPWLHRPRATASLWGAILHMHCFPSFCMSFTTYTQHMCISICAHVSVLVCADDLDSRWVNSQVCPSFSGRIRGRWDCAWLDVSRLMSFPSHTSAATAAAWAKLETGTQAWPAFTRTNLYCPTNVPHYHAAPAPYKTWIRKEHWCIVSSFIKTWFCTWEFNRNYLLNTLALLLVKSHFNFQSVAWPGLVPKGTIGTSQNINIMRHTQWCFYARRKNQPAKLRGWDSLKWQHMNLNVSWICQSHIFVSCNLAPHRDRGHVCLSVWEKGWKMSDLPHYTAAHGHLMQLGINNGWPYVTSLISRITWSSDDLSCSVGAVCGLVENYGKQQRHSCSGRGKRGQRKNTSATSSAEKYWIYVTVMSALLCE